MQRKRLILNGDLNSIKKRSTLSSLLIVIILSFTLDLFSSFIGVIMGILLIILTGVFVPPTVERTTMKSIQKQFDGKNMENSIGSVEFQLDEAGVIRKMQYSTLAFDWDGVIRIGEDQRNYYLFLSKAQVLFLPKHPDGLTETDQLRLEDLIGRVRKRIREEYRASREAAK